MVVPPILTVAVGILRLGNSARNCQKRQIYPEFIVVRRAYIVRDARLPDISRTQHFIYYDQSVTIDLSKAARKTTLKSSCFLNTSPQSSAEA